MVAEKRWSEMSPQELLDVAQRKFNAAEEYPNVRALRMEEARQTLAAAQVQAIENLSWTLQNRTQIGMPEHHGPMPL